VFHLHEFLDPPVRLRTVVSDTARSDPVSKVFMVISGGPLAETRGLALRVSRQPVGATGRDGGETSYGRTVICERNVEGG
jgi:hypothetical protein